MFFTNARYIKIKEKKQTKRQFHNTMNRLSKFFGKNLTTLVEVSAIGAVNGVMHMMLDRDMNDGCEMIIREAEACLGAENNFSCYDIELTKCLIMLFRAIENLVPSQMCNFYVVVQHLAALHQLLLKAEAAEEDTSGDTLTAFFINDQIEFGLTSINSYFPARRTNGTVHLNHIMDSILEVSRNMYSEIRGAINLSCQL